MAIILIYCRPYLKVWVQNKIYMEKELKEHRCEKCNKLFFKSNLEKGFIQIKCKNCKEIISIKSKNCDC